MGAPVSFFDKTPKEVIMRRFHGNVGQVNGLIHKVFHTSHESFNILTTLFFVFKMNYLCLLGLVPFVLMVQITMADSGQVFKELCRCLHKIEKEVSVNQGEIMSGGVTIRAVGSQEYAKKINEQGQDGYVLGQVVMFTTFQWFSMQARKASMILVAIGCVNVILSKNDPDTDIVMLTLLLQRMVELGGRLIGVVHTLSHFEREAIDV
jgi:ABC-type multidrug transport system fused ATPase/permease subunit